MRGHVAFGFDCGVGGEWVWVWGGGASDTVGDGSADVWSYHDSNSSDVYAGSRLERDGEAGRDRGDAGDFGSVWGADAGDGAGSVRVVQLS